MVSGSPGNCLGEKRLENNKWVKDRLFIRPLSGSFYRVKGRGTFAGAAVKIYFNRRVKKPFRR